MTNEERSRLKFAVNAGGCVWLLLIGWLMIATLPDQAIQNHGSSMIKDQMSNCAGSFSERFDCKQKIILASGNETFWTLSLRFLLVIIPPLVASGWLSSYLRRQPLTMEIHHVDDGDWKTRAQMHTEVQSPEQAAKALHLSERELPHLHTPPAHHSIDDIAPLEDWKNKANHNTRGLKRDE